MRRNVCLMSQVLGQSQEQAQLPLATAEALAGHEVKPSHGEGSDFWLTGWSVACEPPFSRAFCTTPGKHNHSIWSNIISKQALLQDLHCMEAVLQDFHCMEALLQDMHKFLLQRHASSQEPVYACNKQSISNAQPQVLEDLYSSQAPQCLP